MNIEYFQETDTLYIEFRTGVIAESRDLDENTRSRKPPGIAGTVTEAPARGSARSEVP